MWDGDLVIKVNQVPLKCFPVDRRIINIPSYQFVDFSNLYFPWYNFL